MSVLFFFRVPVAAAQGVEFERIKDAPPTFLIENCGEFTGRYSRLCRRLKLVRYLQLRRAAEQLRRIQEAQLLLERAKIVQSLLRPIREQRMREQRTEMIYRKVQAMSPQQRRGILDAYDSIVSQGESVCRYKRLSRDRVRCLARWRRDARTRTRGMMERVIFE